MGCINSAFNKKCAPGLYAVGFISTSISIAILGAMVVGAIVVGAVVVIPEYQTTLRLVNTTCNVNGTLVGEEYRARGGPCWRSFANVTYATNTSCCQNAVIPLACTSTYLEAVRVTQSFAQAHNASIPCYYDSADPAVVYFSNTLEGVALWLLVGLGIGAAVSFLCIPISVACIGWGLLTMYVIGKPTVESFLSRRSIDSMELPQLQTSQLRLME